MCVCVQMLTCGWIYGKCRFDGVEEIVHACGRSKSLSVAELVFDLENVPRVKSRENSGRLY